MSNTVHPVDERLPTGKLAALGLQHVLVMYAGAILRQTLTLETHPSCSTCW